MKIIGTTKQSTYASEHKLLVEMSVSEWGEICNSARMEINELVPGVEMAVSDLYSEARKTLASFQDLKKALASNRDATAKLLAQMEAAPKIEKKA